MTAAYPAAIAIPPAERPVSGTVHLPGSKSITNRALLIAGLADGQSTIEGALFSDDTHYLSAALRALGCAVSEDPASERFVVTGAGGPFPARAADLFVGNAGTAMRFLVGALPLGHGRFRVDGVPRMRQRPIGPLLDGLRQLGASVRAEFDNGCPPVLIEANGLRGGAVRMPGNRSSQYFSALMMAAPLTENGVVIEVEGELVSRPFLDLTLAVMAAFGAAGEHEAYRRIVVPGGQRYRGRHFRVEPDATAASYFFAAAALTGGTVTVAGLSEASAQGDLRFVEVLERMGCRVERGAAGVTVRGPERLRGVDADFGAISDTALTLAAIAPFADSPVRVRGIAHARLQESDRVAAMATELRKLGVPVEEHPDGWTIAPAQPRGGEVDTYDDHRMAMSFAVLSLRTPGVVIRDPRCVAKTFPDFFERFGRLIAG
ncbi:MAG: 3-phosphoshikimate 1-carboxyvinyltransferase [Chloroflexota bacterium]|nr:3-phosphoshikimate 1-carboxyvinyltransferase [Dehalococcoidia bacterium]MDW8253941.1 3-phosphoshikimate 1-carboxyvinyltransferase [Chloroflexota bacterium]